MAVQLMPKVDLEPRDSDISLTNEQFLQISLFQQLGRKPTLEKFPGALVLRHFRKGEEVFRQGDPGWTAFYILTTEDMLKVRQFQLETTNKENEKRALPEKIQELNARMEELKTAGPDDELRQMASVHIAIARASPAVRQKLARKLLNFKTRVVEGPTRNDQGKTLYIPRGGPDTISYDTLKAFLEEGEIFGEMSCLYRTPRSGTVRAERDFFAIEMLRNIFDAIQRDKAYKTQADQVHQKRVLDLQVRKLSLFADLDDEQFNAIRPQLELVYYEPGQLIADEHEQADCMYIVRLGLVKVMKNVSWLVGVDDITNWPAFCQSLIDGLSKPGESPERTLWMMLPEKTRIQLRTTDDFEKLTAPEQLDILYGVNNILKSEKMTDAKPMESITGTEAFQKQIADFPAKRKDWNARHIRKHNRILLETLVPQGLRKHKHYSALESILSYRSQGEYFGEMGLMLNRPRSATCIAYGHPNDIGQVELVRVPSAVFHQMTKYSEAIRESVKKEVASRRRDAILRLAAPVWDDKNQVQFSEQFERLGLIQGQRLMLIDLDRCTRCDECVKACVNTHEEGYTRLFLDGPRFGNYLVPTSCRSCLDPVCLIGCPVASIHRGANREIVVEDWCIGCSACADNCPYGSIQMHDLGLVPETQRGWRFLPATQVKEDNWHSPKYRENKWLVGASPFKWNRDLQELTKDDPLDQLRFRFRFEFSLSRDLFKKKGARIRFQMVAPGGNARLWLNGIELTVDEKPKRGRHEYTVPPVKTAEPDSEAPGKMKLLPITDFLKKGMNLVAAEVSPPDNSNEVLFQFRVDEVRRPKDLPDEVDPNVVEEVTEKLVTSRAVVCDLCSDAPGKVAACVHACPHDAAMRVDARSNFPMK